MTASPAPHQAPPTLLEATSREVAILRRELTAALQENERLRAEVFDLKVRITKLRGVSV